MSVLQVVAAHVLGRRRWDVTGRFGLRVTPGGIATPMFGDECLRIAGGWLVREMGGAASYTAISGSSVRELALFVGTDVDRPFSCGEDTPPVGDPDALVELGDIDPVVSWLWLGWQALDAVIAGSDSPATIQLWPEHFDIGTNVAVPKGDRVNLGCSAGDSFSEEPYLYVGPWGSERPGDPYYWNAPFGAVLRSSDVVSIDDGIAFLRTGLEALV